MLAIFLSIYFFEKQRKRGDERVGFAVVRLLDLTTIALAKKATERYLCSSQLGAKRLVPSVSPSFCAQKSKRWGGNCGFGTRLLKKHEAQSVFLNGARRK